MKVMKTVHKFPANFTDENYDKVKELATKSGCSMNTIVNQCVSEFCDSQEEKTLLQTLKKSLRDSERKLNVLYSAFNNFFLNFAPNMDGYVPSGTTLHRWLVEANKEEEVKIQQTVTKKKWTGTTPTANTVYEKLRNEEIDGV